MEWIALAIALLIILLGAELFTNGVEWVGEQHGLSEGAVGSVLAAVGTALPETILPLVAIVSGGGEAASQEIGIGAILGAPFMLTTLAMFVLGTAVLIFSRGGRRSKELDGEDTVILQDLGYFLVMYFLAVVAGVIHVRELHWALAVFLMVSYGFYVRRHFAMPGEDEESDEAEGEVKPLYAWKWTHGRDGSGWSKDSHHGWTYVQVAVALVLIVGGARLFVSGISVLSENLGIAPLVFALLLAPVATELPEKFNSVLWVRRRKDTLALGNMTGAMVFQSSFPVSVGLLLTSWNLLDPKHPEALVSAVIALLAGSTLWVTMKIRGKFQAWLLLLQGAFYVAYVAYVFSRI
jgi:cation:H+ antiporter